MDAATVALYLSILSAVSGWLVAFWIRGISAAVKELVTSVGLHATEIARLTALHDVLREEVNKLRADRHDTLNKLQPLMLQLQQALRERSG